MKRILLTIPKGNGPGNGRRWNDCWPQELEEAITDNMWRLVTPGPLVIASLTDHSKYRIDLVDEEFEAVNMDVDYDIAAFYTVTPNARRSYMLAGSFREKGAYIVMGGVHASICPEEAALYSDTVLVGEAESIWPEFLSDLERGHPKKRYVQPVGTVDISMSPTPAFEFLPESGRRIIPIQTARGCPHGCTFCNLRSIYGKGYRAKSISRVLEEIKEAMKVKQRPIIYFTDDNLFCDLKRALRLVEELEPFGITWYANSDLLFSKDENFLKRAYKSGLRQVLIGFESVNPSNLKGIDESGFKSKHASSYRSIIKQIQSQGIGVVGSFIVGLDGDGPDVFEKMRRFVDDTSLYGASITVNTPYPGTVLFEKMKRQGRILTQDWDKYTIFQPVIRPLGMSVEELNEGYVSLLKDLNSFKKVMDRLKYFKEMAHKTLKG